MAEINNLSLLNFRFQLNITPEVQYRVQSVTLPTISLGFATQPTPFIQAPEPGNLSYDELVVTFMVGENMADYLEIYNWMNKLGKPDRYEQYEKVKSDGSVIILNSAQRPIISVKFTEMFPTSLSAITFDSTLPEMQYATATASFKFTRLYYDPI